MLGSRSHRVVTYGKRGHRIINRSEDNENASARNNKQDKDADLLRTPVALKTKMRQHFPSESPSPRLTRMHNRKSSTKRLSPSLSPATLKKRRARIHQNIEGDILSKSKSKSDASSNRRPLTASTYHPNVPASPAVGKKKKSRVVGAKGTPVSKKTLAPFSPFVDVDIIMLDDEGRRVSQERRVSRTDVVVNPPEAAASDKAVKKARKVSAKKPKPDVIELLSDSEEEAAPKPPKRIAGRLKAIVISSDESDADDTPMEISKPSIFKSRPRMQVEVVIPQYVRPKPKPAPVEVQVELPAPSPPSIPRFEQLPVPQPPRERQLTPIRRGTTRGLFRRPASPPSPTTPSDLDVSLDFDFSELSLTSPNSNPSIANPEYIVPLLEQCSQTSPHEFSAFIETFPFDPIVQPVDDDQSAPVDVQFRKIGEASYSEVFGIGNVVLKVIPLREDVSASAPVPMAELETPFPSEAKDVLKEIIVTKAIGDACDGFVKLLRTYIVRGRYPELLLSLWDEYDERKGSESVRPDGFHLSQTYAIIVLPNGGPDLETYNFTNAGKTGWRQACSLFWQVARTLAQAEERVQFEHRDLHWGQILVKTVSIASTGSPRRKSKSKLSMDDPSHGVIATVIDLGLARMNGDEGVHWTPFDDEVFEGEGDYQFDIYRMMESSIGEEYRPITNIMWLHYLAQKLLHAKRLKPPPVSRKTAATLGSANTFNERDCYEALVETEVVLAKCVKDAKKKKGRKPAADSAGPALRSAEELVNYGVDKGWIR